MKKEQNLSSGNPANCFISNLHDYVMLSEWNNELQQQPERPWRMKMLPPSHSLTLNLTLHVEKLRLVSSEHLLHKQTLNWLSIDEHFAKFYSNHSSLVTATLSSTIVSSSPNTSRVKLVLLKFNDRISTLQLHYHRHHVHVRERPRMETHQIRLRPDSAAKYTHFSPFPPSLPRSTSLQCFLRSTFISLMF